jgi:hypothetical protein
MFGDWAAEVMSIEVSQKRKFTLERWMVRRGHLRCPAGGHFMTRTEYLPLDFAE